jgi:hypothetical protein
LAHPGRLLALNIFVVGSTGKKQMTFTNGAPPKGDWPLFIALTPLVVGAVLVLLPWSIFGIMIGVGILGVLGVAGLFWSWIALLGQRKQSPGTIAQKILLCCGFVVSFYGVSAFQASLRIDSSGDVDTPFLLAQWCAIYAGLAMFFLCRQGKSLSWNGSTRFARLGPYAFVLFIWCVSIAIIAIPFHMNRAGARARHDAKPEVLSERAFDTNPFALAFCKDDMTAAADALKQPNLFPNESVLSTAIEKCLYTPNSGQVNEHSQSDVKLNVALAAIDYFETQLPLSERAPCSNLRRSIMHQLYGHADFAGLEEISKKRFRLDCISGITSSAEPQWFSLFSWHGSSSHNLTVDNLKRLQALGIDLHQSDRYGNHFFNWQLASNAPADVKAFLASQGIVQKYPLRPELPNPASPPIATFIAWHAALLKNDFVTYRRLSFAGTKQEAHAESEENAHRELFDLDRGRVPTIVWLAALDTGAQSSGTVKFVAIGCRDEHSRFAKVIVHYSEGAWRVAADRWADGWDNSWNAAGIPCKP